MSTFPAAVPMPRQPRRSAAAEYGAILQFETARLTPIKMIPPSRALSRLTDSIVRFGIMHPLLVKLSREGEQEKLLVVDGAKRLAAAQALGLRSLPCLLEAQDDTEERIATIKSLDGQPFAQAQAIADFIAVCSLTQQDAARRLSMSQSTIANKLRLLRLTPDEQKQISAMQLSERHARALVSLHPDQRQTVLERIETDKLNVAETEAYIDTLRLSSTPPRKAALRDIGLFYNSIDRALMILQHAGVAVTLDRVEAEDAITLTIRVCSPNVSRETKPSDVSRETSAQPVPIS